MAACEQASEIADATASTAACVVSSDEYLMVCLSWSHRAPTSRRLRNRRPRMGRTRYERTPMRTVDMNTPAFEGTKSTLTGVREYGKKNPPAPSPRIAPVGLELSSKLSFPAWRAERQLPLPFRSSAGNFHVDQTIPREDGNISSGFPRCNRKLINLVALDGSQYIALLFPHIDTHELNEIAPALRLGRGRQP